MAILLPFRFGLLYVIPGTYKFWGLGRNGLEWAARLRVITWFTVAALLIALGLVVASAR